MPYGKTHPHFTVHVTDDLAEKVRERAKGHPSVAAYIRHLILIDLHGNAQLDMEIAASVRRTIELVSKQL